MFLYTGIKEQFIIKKTYWSDKYKICFLSFSLAVKSMQVCRYNRGVTEQGSLPGGSLFGLTRASSSSYIHLPIVQSEAMANHDITGSLPQPSAEQFAPHPGLPVAPLQAVVSVS